MLQRNDGNKVHTAEQLRINTTTIFRKLTLLGQGWTQRIAAHALEPIPLPGWYDEARMQIEAVGPRVTSFLSGRFALLGRVAQTTKAGIFLLAAPLRETPHTARDPTTSACTSICPPTP